MNDIVKKATGKLVTKSGALNLTEMKKRRAGLQPVYERLGGDSLQLLMMFDITSSMFGYFNLIREKLSEIVGLVSSRAPKTQFSVFAYRNHGDEDLHEHIYYTNEFTTNIEILNSKINSIKKGGGGKDALTCMEECFMEANKLPWISSCPKAIVLVGDMPPHGVMDSFEKCPNGIRYIDEVKEFCKKGIKVYSVFAGYRDASREFFAGIARDTGGKFLNISEIDILKDLLVGICMKETGNLTKYLESLKKNKQLTSNTEKALLMLE